MHGRITQASVLAIRLSLISTVEVEADTVFPVQRAWLPRIGSALFQGIEASAGGQGRFTIGLLERTTFSLLSWL